jgi:uncharacterized protein (DUF885 family)
MANTVPSKETEDDWIAVSPVSDPNDKNPVETMQDRIVRIKNDVYNLETFYNIHISTLRIDRLDKYFSDEIEALELVKFKGLSQGERIDYILLKNYLGRKRRQLKQARENCMELFRILPFAEAIISICEQRQRVIRLEGKDTARKLQEVIKSVAWCHGAIERDEIDASELNGYRAAIAMRALVGDLIEAVQFYANYDPTFDWWVKQPWNAANAALSAIIPVIRTKLARMDPEIDDEIVGEPIGARGLESELRAELIPYTPKQLIWIAHQEFQWCEIEMKKASAELGFDEDWKRALEHVKDQHAEPGDQPEFVRQLAQEATAYVTKNDLVTVPGIASETWRMFMMPPALQKTAPFFLGGPALSVAYPTVDMSHDEKEMAMRGNNKHFSKATVFHEMIPGHRLQLFMADRHKPYRKFFFTPFYVEGWAMYWEQVLWARGDFFVSPEDRIGFLFWRMHRCARIIFSLKFHLGEMTPQECVDLLVNWVGHERSEAEAEVRRSFNTDAATAYAPLYQAAYMLGSLQLFALRREVLEGNVMSEKAFHDRVLKENSLPIELLRAAILGYELTKEYEATWKFYGDIPE